MTNIYFKLKSIVQIENLIIFGLPCFLAHNCIVYIQLLFAPIELILLGNVKISILCTYRYHGRWKKTDICVDTFSHHSRMRHLFLKFFYLDLRTLITNQYVVIKHYIQKRKLSTIYKRLVFETLVGFLATKFLKILSNCVDLDVHFKHEYSHD